MEGELLSLSEIEGRGRALVAAQPLKGGQIILRDSPILLYSALPLTPSSNCYCDYCFKILKPISSSTTTSCPNCGLHFFCNSNCLSASQSSSHSDWVCQSLRRLRQNPSPLPQQSLERQVQARFLLAAYNLAIVSPSRFQTLLSFQGQVQSLDPCTAEAAQFLHSLLSSFCPLPVEGLFSLELTNALLAKDKLNAFGLMEPFSEQGQRSVRAYGLYAKASFFNHDCLPNACRFDYVDTAIGPYNTDIVIRMIHDVPQGREICLSYFPVDENYASRQKRLLEEYGFACDCDRCKVEANWSDNDDDDDDCEIEQEDEYEYEEHEVMDEDQDQNMESTTLESEAQGDSNFPHAYFFMRYMCNRNNCFGTMAPLPPTGDSASNTMECNVCGNHKNVDEIDGNKHDELSMDE